MRNSHRALTEIQMPSRFSESPRLRKVVCHLASATLCDQKAAADVETAVGEAFTNAIKFGAEDGKVCVKVESPEWRALSIEMAYPGCDLDGSVRYPQNVLNAEGGFGRCIARKMIDSMEYSFEDGKTTLRITKRRN
jgi:anti-sigma regulatory factor (Ser/Thr protein kinase)